MSWYDFKQEIKQCRRCAWAGMGSEMTTGEAFNDGCDYHCPRCGERYGFVAYPLLRESMTDPRAPEEDRLFATFALRGAQRMIEQDSDDDRGTG